LHDDRQSAHKRGYGRAWQRLRALKLATDPLCEYCKARNRITPATEVDHYKPRERGGTDDWENLRSACKSCHSSKTAREDGGFGNRKPGAKGGR